jgi:hypothetical protein
MNREAFVGYWGEYVEFLIAACDARAGRVLDQWLEASNAIGMWADPADVADASDSFSRYWNEKKVLERQRTARPVPVANVNDVLQICDRDIIPGLEQIESWQESEGKARWPTAFREQFPDYNPKRLIKEFGNIASTLWRQQTEAGYTLAKPSRMPTGGVSVHDAIVYFAELRDWAAEAGGIKSKSRLGGGSPGRKLMPGSANLQVRRKKSTERGDGRVKLVAALTNHHKYADGGCLNFEPVGNNELARLAEVGTATASEFFKKQFKGHSKYKAMCGNSSTLVGALKLLNQEFAPHQLYGRNPPGEGDRDDE